MINNYSHKAPKHDSNGFVLKPENWVYNSSKDDESRGMNAGEQCCSKCGKKTLWGMNMSGKWCSECGHYVEFIEY